MKKQTKLMLIGASFFVLGLGQAIVRADVRFEPKPEVIEALSQGDKELESKNYKNAFEFYKQAAEYGYSPAQVKMGLIYKDGVLVQKDLKEAEYWLALASVQRDPEGLYNYGLLFKERDDLMEAIYWFNLAYQYGDESIKKLVDEQTKF